MDKAKLITDIIKSRRSIFPPMYTGDKVSDDVIWEILDNANWAPTHKMTQPWRFIVIPQEKISDWVDYAAEWYRRYTPEDKFSEVKHTKIKTKPLKASHIIAIIMSRDKEKRVPKWEEKAAVACAVQNMYLTITAMDLGGYWSTPTYALGADEYFDLKSRERCLGLFYIGVPQEDIDLSSKRDDIRSKVTWL